MPDLNEQFLANPQKFARQWALYPTQGHRAFAMNAEHIKVLGLDEHRAVQQVQGTNKVRYCEIRRPAGLGVAGDFGGLYDLDLNLCAMRITNLPASASSFPVYYLPWAENETARMKLKPSPNHPARDGRGRIIDPDVFVTAAVQGCSVFIDGTQEQPLIYHINAAGTGGPVFEAGTDALARQSARAKIDEMRNRHERAQRLFPKDRRNRNPRHAPKRYSAEAHMTNYMGAFVTPTGRGELTARHDTASIWNLWGLLGGGHTETIQAGSIFGIRRNGKWVFFRQTRTRITYDVLEPNDAPYGPPVVRRESKWLATQCVQFWPTYRG